MDGVYFERQKVREKAQLRAVLDRVIQHRHTGVDWDVSDVHYFTSTHALRGHTRIDVPLRRRYVRPYYRTPVGLWIPA